MKFPFSRWLPAIAENPRARKGALVCAGLAFLGTAAVTPGAQLPSPPVDPTAAAALRQATSTDGSTTTSQPAGTPTVRKPADSVPRRLVPDAAEEPSGRSATGVRTDKPDLDQLIPYGTQGEQSYAPLTEQRWRNAWAIVQVTKRSGLGERAAVIAVATALQESKLENLGHLGAYNDHDSQGLFQQRPSSGWGSPEQVTDPEYSTSAFLNGLRRIDRWWDLPLTDAAQRVQVSAYPFAYAQWERQAADIVQQTWDD